jgi:Tfp pilus assembly protein PilF
MSRAYIYWNRGDLPNALADIDKALTIEPKNQKALSWKQQLQKAQAATAPAQPSNAPGVANPAPAKSAPPKKP